MKYAGVIDCGTTNSRFSVVDECGDIIASGAAKIGVKDTAIHGTKEVLKKDCRHCSRIPYHQQESMWLV